MEFHEKLQELRKSCGLTQDELAELLYFLFEKVVINYRPVLIEGVLEASYPSSTTMLTPCVIPTAILQFKSRIKNVAIRKTVLTVLAIFAAFMVIGRLISGAHWLTDIIGGI